MKVKRLSNPNRLPNLSDLQRISWTLETGLESGKDWLSILRWISENDTSLETRKYLRRLLEKMRVHSIERGLQEEKDLNERDLLWKMFFEILLQTHAGSPNLSLIYQNFSSIASSFTRLKQKESSLLFLPKFQSAVALAISFGFIFGLPFLSSGLFPTFLSLKRYDLFAACLSPVLAGFILLHWMCQRPRRMLAPQLSSSFFLYFLSVFVDSGVDLATAWRRAVESVDLPLKVRAQFARSNLQVDLLDDFFLELQKKMSKPWPEILSGLLWSKHSGVGVSQYLRMVSLRESERVLFEWEDEVRKLTLTTLLPLGLLIFPGTLALLIGPQLVELISL